MTRGPGDRVSLSLSNWIALAMLVVLTVGPIVTSSIYVYTAIATLKSDVKSLEKQVDKLEQGFNQ